MPKTCKQPDRAKPIDVSQDQGLQKPPTVGTHSTARDGFRSAMMPTQREPS